MKGSIGKLHVISMLERMATRVAREGNGSDYDAPAYTDEQTQSIVDNSVTPAKITYCYAFVFVSESKSTRDQVAHLVGNINRMQTSRMELETVFEAGPREQAILDPDSGKVVAVRNISEGLYNCPTCTMSFDMPILVGKKGTMALCPHCHHQVKI